MGKVALTLACLLCALSSNVSISSAFTCADLDGAYVYSQEIVPVYLGFFGNSFEDDSINNIFGTYGSQFNDLSVRNILGDYGSSFGVYSANNDFGYYPPAIYKWGYLVGYLTTNDSIAGGVPLSVIDSSCSFYAFRPYSYPWIPMELSASDGLYTDEIHLSWGITPGAESYNVYFSESLEGEKAYINTFTGTTVVLTGVEPDKTYFFWVSAINIVGESYLSYADSGYAAAADILAGDINNDGSVNLKDAVLSLQPMALIDISGDLHLEADVNGDSRIGLEEAIHALRVISGSGLQ